MKTVTIPVMRKAHQAQFLPTPFSRTMPVTRLGVSAEKVQATMEIPSSHQGIPRPPRKNSEVLLPAVREATHPMPSTMAKKMLTIIQSIVTKCIYQIFIIIFFLYIHSVGRKMNIPKKQRLNASDAFMGLNIEEKTFSYIHEYKD